MNYQFIIENEKIKNDSELTLYSGNVETYTFCFEFGPIWEKMSIFATFVKDDTEYAVPVVNGEVKVPAQVLEEVGSFVFGVFGVSSEGVKKRLSSERISVRVEKGAYSTADLPETPESDAWENFVKSCTPQRGVDYWTEKDKAEIKAYVDDAILGGEW